MINSKIEDKANLINDIDTAIQKTLKDITGAGQATYQTVIDGIILDVIAGHSKKQNAILETNTGEQDLIYFQVIDSLVLTLG